MSAIHQTIAVALVAAFIILFLGKTGLRTKLRDFSDKNGILPIANMLDCDFCLSFWTCLLVTMCLWANHEEPHLLVIFCAPPITRYIL